MFRRDPMRSCSTPVELPERLSPKWKSAPGGELTPPVIVGDSVFLASVDNCQVYCLNSADGKLKWRFAADGPVNAPPTYCRGQLVFGTRAGTLYALTSDEGELIWSFRAGPSRVRIVAFGRLESPWPLNGSPLVLDGDVYCVAGRSMSLRLRHLPLQARSADRRTATGDQPFGQIPIQREKPSAISWPTCLSATARTST